MMPPQPPPGTAPKPLVPGYGATVVSSGGQELYRFHFCHRCFAMVPDDAFAVTGHNEWHAQLDKTLADLKAQFVIQEQP